MAEVGELLPWHIDLIKTNDTASLSPALWSLLFEMLQFNIACHKSNPQLENYLPPKGEHMSWFMEGTRVPLRESTVYPIAAIKIASQWKWPHCAPACTLHVHGYTSLPFYKLCDFWQVVDVLLDSIAVFLKWSLYFPSPWEVISIKGEVCFFFFKPSN